MNSMQSRYGGYRCDVSLYTSLKTTIDDRSNPIHHACKPNLLSNPIHAIPAPILQQLPISIYPINATLTYSFRVKGALPIP
jgi:hypothetical protein